jgi:hypothetical protein
VDISAEEEDSDLDELTRSMLKEIMPADQKVKPIFRAPTKQSKLIDIFV